MRTRVGVITFLTREGCTLCDEALAGLRAPARLFRVSVTTVDVDDFTDLADQYGDRVPVMLSGGGAVLTEGRFSTRDAWGAVWRARRGR